MLELALVNLKLVGQLLLLQAAEAAAAAAAGVAGSGKDSVAVAAGAGAGAARTLPYTIRQPVPTPHQVAAVGQH